MHGHEGSSCRSATFLRRRESAGTSLIKSMRRRRTTLGRSTVRKGASTVAGGRADTLRGHRWRHVTQQIRESLWAAPLGHFFASTSCSSPPTRGRRSLRFVRPDLPRSAADDCLELPDSETISPGRGALRVHAARPAQPIDAAPCFERGRNVVIPFGETGDDVGSAGDPEKLDVQNWHAISLVREHCPPSSIWTCMRSDPPGHDHFAPCSFGSDRVPPETSLSRAARPRVAPEPRRRPSSKLRLASVAAREPSLESWRLRQTHAEAHIG